MAARMSALEKNRLLKLWHLMDVRNQELGLARYDYGDVQSHPLILKVSSRLFRRGFVKIFQRVTYPHEATGIKGRDPIKGLFCRRLWRLSAGKGLAPVHQAIFQAVIFRHRAPSRVSVISIPMPVNRSRIRSAVAQSFAALALSRCAMSSAISWSGAGVPAPRAWSTFGM